jgi:hypothetical protein
MCSVAAAVLLGGGLTGVNYLGQRQRAKSQEAFQARSLAAEGQRSAQEQTSIRMQEAQKQEAVGRELEQVSIKSKEALARARVSAGEAGVAGASIQSLMDDYIRQEAGYRAAALRQQELGGIGTGLALEQAQFASTQRQIGIGQPITQPSLLTATLQGATQAAQLASSAKGLSA